jgi:hypothetical protein
MDIAAVSVIMSQTQVQQSASMSVMKMAMQTAQQEAVDLVQALNSTSAVQAAAQPHLGTKLDVIG